MKKSELIKRIEALEKLTDRVEFLESMQENNRKSIEKIKKDIFHKGGGPMFDRFYYEGGIPTYKKIEKILEHLEIAIFEKASEIKVISIKPKKKKGKKIDWTKKIGKEIDKALDKIDFD